MPLEGVNSCDFEDIQAENRQPLAVINRDGSGKLKGKWQLMSFKTPYNSLSL